MRLPDADQAVVEKAKITEYLLSPDHPDGRSKAEFFVRFGFRQQNWEILAEALRVHGAAHPVTRTAASQWGTRYSVDGALDCPDGRRPRLRSVWIVETFGVSEDGAPPRLITASLIFIKFPISFFSSSLKYFSPN